MATKVKLIETGAVTGNIIPDGGIKQPPKNSI